jgi:hypothetical protein
MWPTEKQGCRVLMWSLKNLLVTKTHSWRRCQYCLQWWLNQLTRLLHAVAQWLRHYPINRKIAGSRPHEVNEFCQFNPFGRSRPWGSTQPLTEMSTRSRKIMFLGSIARPVRRADNLTAICELSRHCGILNISQRYRPPRPVAGTALTAKYMLHLELFQTVSKFTEFLPGCSQWESSSSLDFLTRISQELCLKHYVR